MVSKTSHIKPFLVLHTGGVAVRDLVDVLVAMKGTGIAAVVVFQNKRSFGAARKAFSEGIEGWKVADAAHGMPVVPGVVFLCDPGESVEIKNGTVHVFKTASEEDKALLFDFSSGEADSVAELTLHKTGRRKKTSKKTNVAAELSIPDRNSVRKKINAEGIGQVAAELSEFFAKVRKKHELQLSLFRDPLSLLIDQLENIPVYGCDKSGRVTRWNQACEKIFGYSAQEAIGSMLTDLIIPETQQHNVLKSVKKLLEGEKTYMARERTRLRKDGEEISVLTHKTLVRSPAGPELIFIDIDLTPRIEAEERIRQTTAMLEERVKEQQCLYRIAKLKEQDFSLENLLKEAAGYIREGLRWPERAEVMAVVNQKAYRTPGYNQKLPGLESKVSNKRFSLQVRVIYRDTDDSEALSFLEEEANLLDAAAEMLLLKISERDSKLELKRSRDGLRKILDESLDIICTFHEDGRFDFVSNASRKILGYSPEEMSGERYLDFVHEEDFEKTQKAATEIREGRFSTDFENRYIAKDGRIVDMRWSAYWDDETRLFYGVARDITERKKVEEKLAESEKRFKALIQEGQELVCILDEQGRFKYASPSYKRTLGADPEKLIGKSAFDFVHPQDFDRVVGEEFGRLRQVSAVKSVRYRAITKTGETIWVQSSGTNLLNDPAVKGIVINSVEITDVITAQQQLHKSEKRLRKASEIAKIGYWRFNSKTKQLYWSEEVYDIWGVDKNDFQVSYDSLLRTVHPEDLSLFYTQEKKAYEGQSEIDFDHRIVLPDGSVKWVREMTQRIKDPKSPDDFILEGTVQDITRQKEEKNRLLMLESVAVNSTDGVLIAAPGSDNFGNLEIIYANRAAGAVFESGPEEFENLKLRMLFSGVLNTESKRKLDEAVRLKKAQSITFFARLKGRMPWYDLELTPVFGSDSNLNHWLIILHDITRSKQDEQQKIIRSDIATLFDSSSGLKDSLRKVTDYLADLYQSDFTEIWLVDSSASRVSFGASSETGRKAALFRKAATEIRNFQKGEGLPGNVWATGEKLIWRNPSTHPSFARKKAAETANISCVCGIPVLQGQEVSGVVVFGLSGDNAEPVISGPLLDIIEVFLGAEIKRKQLEEELDKIYSLAPDLICTLGPDGILKSINPAGLQLLKTSLGDVVGKPILELVFPEDREKAKKMFAFESGEKENRYGELRFITNVGSTVWLAWTLKFVEEEHLVYGIAKDVSEKKNLENLLQSATELARVGSWEADIKTGDMYWSEMTREIHEEKPGFTPELPGGITYFKEGVERKTMESAVELAIQKGKRWDLELPIITAKGNERWIRTIGEAEFHESKCVRLFGSFQDIHARKMAEFALSRRNRFLDTIARVMEIFLKAESIEKAIDESFRLAGETVEADRVYFFEVDEEASTKKSRIVHLRYEWCGEGILPDIENEELQNHEISRHPEIYEPLREGRPAHVIVSKLKDKAFREMTSSSGIKSILLLPVFSKGVLKGYLGFDDCKQEREWKQADIYLLQSIASYMAVELERRTYLLQMESTIEERNTILESIGDGFFALDYNSTVVYWNKMAEELLLMKRGEILGKELLEVFNVNDESAFYEKYIKAMETGKPVHFVEFFPPLNKWFEVSAYPARGKLGVYFRDISERKRSEELLRESNERFEKATMATNDAIYDWQVESDKVYWGDGFTTLFGLLPGTDLHGIASWENHIHPDDRERAFKVLQDAMENPEREHFTMEYRFKKYDGSYAEVYDRGMIMRDENEKAVRITGAMSDITMRKQYEKSLKEMNIALENRARELMVSNQELEQFAYVASHDLQEPLRMISSFLKQLEKKYSDRLDEKAHTYIHYAVDGAARMREIILDLLEYSRAGKETEEMVPVDTHKVAEEVLTLYRQTIAEKEAEIEIGELPVVKSYHAPVQQIFSNLVGNALKYSAPDRKPKIEISSEIKNGKLVFCIKDNGIGIDSEYHEKIFVIFQRLHHKGEYSGTGMGLAIVKKILDKLGGSIWIESKEGEGSAFYFTLNA